MAGKRTKTVEPDLPSPKRRWILALVLIFFSIGWIAAIVTYAPLDPPGGSGGHFGTYLNALGPVGSYLAYFSIQLGFGKWLTYVLPLLLSWFAVYLFFPGWKPPYLKGFLPVLLGTWLVSCWMALGQSFQSILEYSEEAIEFETVGFLGGGFVKICFASLNPLGSILIVLGLTLVFIGVYFGKQLKALFLAWLERRARKAERNKYQPVVPKIVEPVRTVKSVAPVEEPLTTYNDDIPDDYSEPEDKPVKPERIPRKKKEVPAEIVQEAMEFTATGLRIVKPAPVKVVEENMPPREFDEGSYELPPLDMFIPNEIDIVEEPYEELAEKLLQTLKEFNVHARVSTIHPGPVVTRYDFVPGPGVKVASFANLSDDIARAMRAISVRILAPIPGEEAVGIEIPNRKPRIVRFREVVESALFQKDNWILPVAVGLTTDGQPVVTDLAKLPHLLIAGTTGSGKSVFINCLLGSLLLRKTPEEVKIALIDPKMLELTPYKVLAKHHLVQLAGADPVVTKPAQAVKLLQACVAEMERRLDILTEAGVRDLKEYRERHRKGAVKAAEPLSFIVVVIDELADLMLASAKEIEDPIQRISQMARATGIHLVVATQRPSVNVITGVIKANLPARLAFQVASSTDSRTILDQTGADKLLGKGDALFSPPWEMKPVRVHGCLIEGNEIDNILQWVSVQPQAAPLVLEPPHDNKSDDGGDVDDRDQLFAEAARVCVRAGQGSVAIIRRRMRVGYSRAGRLLDQLEQAGIVGRFDGSKPREVLISMDTLEEMLGGGTDDE